jgi:multidrug resistance efflux pump
MAKPLKWIGAAIVLGGLSLGAFVLLAPGHLGIAKLYGRIFGHADDGAALRLPGVVETQEVRLGSKVGGRVAEVRAEEGQLVEPGTVLVTFDVPELKAQRDQWQARLESEEAALLKAIHGPRKQELAAADAAVKAAEERWKRSKVGYRQEEIRQARSDLDSALADLTLAEEELHRTERLRQEQTVAQAELDSARATYDRSKGRAASARARMDMLASGNRPEDIAEAAALLAQSRANLELLKAGTRAEEIAQLRAQVAETRGKLEELEANLAESTVRAPSRAVIDVISVRKGDLIAAGQPVVRALNASDLWVKIYIPETKLARVRLNQFAAVTVDGYPEHRFQGKVTFIASQSEFTPRNIQTVDERRHQVFAAKVRVDDPQGIFKSGMSAMVTLRETPAEGQ